MIIQGSGKNNKHAYSHLWTIASPIIRSVWNSHLLWVSTKCIRFYVWLLEMDPHHVGRGRGRIREEHKPTMVEETPSATIKYYQLTTPKV